MGNRIAVTVSAFTAILMWAGAAFALDACLLKAVPFDVYAEQLVGKDWLREHVAFGSVGPKAVVFPQEGPVITTLKRAADNGDAESQYLFAEVLLYEKYGCAYGPARSSPGRRLIETYLRRSSEAAFTAGRFALAEFYWNELAVEKGLAYFRIRTNDNDPFAELFVARAYECGWGAQKSQTAALRSFELAKIHTKAIDFFDPHYGVSIHDAAKAGIARLKHLGFANTARNPQYVEQCPYLLNPNY